MKMLNLNNIGKRAGSGMQSIFNVWADEGWKESVIEEKFESDRTVLSLSYVKKENEKMNEVLSQKNYEKTLLIIEYLKRNSIVTT